MKPFLGTEKKPNKEPSLPNGQALLASSIEVSDWSRYEKQAKNLTAEQAVYLISELLLFRISLLMQLTETEHLRLHLQVINLSSEWYHLQHLLQALTLF